MAPTSRNANNVENPLEFYASCPEGFERALADELKSMGTPRIRQLKGRVTFGGNVEDAYRVCLWSRLASRVFALIARFDCANADELYAECRSIAWEDILCDGATIAATARGTNDELRNTHFTALRVKDALCDRMIEATGTRPSVDTEHASAHIACSIRGERASLHLDLTGEPLFKRLPRDAARPGAAHVLRPDYAALLLMQASWHRSCAAPDNGAPTLIDASCAGGGIVLEAVNMLLDRAPNIQRAHWGFEGWKHHDAEAWHRLLTEAATRAEAGSQRRALIIATDVSAGSAEFARRIVRKAGFARYVTFVPATCDAILEALESSPRRDHAAETARTAPQPIIVADTTETSFNRLPQMLSLITGLRNAPQLATAPIAALTRDDMLRRAVGQQAAETLFVKPNNEDACIVTFAALDTERGSAAAQNPSSKTTPADAYRIEGQAEAASAPASAHGQTPDAASPSAPSAAPTPGTPTTAASTTDAPLAATGSHATATGTSCIDLGDGTLLPALIPESEQFARRLRKVARLRRKWAARESVTCYRVYDADLPDYAAAIDLYEGSAATPGRWLVIAEYGAPKSVDPALAQARLLDILTIAPRVLNVDADNVYAKARIRSRGGSQYGKRPHATGNGSGAAKPDLAQRRLPLIEEGGLTFAVNFDDYLDTGIFLDHRVTRNLVRERAKQARWFLNLFAYTGTATCYAADAGVEETVTVDLSNTYLDWAERNMRQNGFTGREHHFVRADVLQWISEQRRTSNRWDLIFCDPPTFSNSSKMGRRTWDVQRDHVELLIGVSRLLTREGEAIFSCNLRTFKPDTEALARAGVVLTDITPETIPEDFARNPRIHRCYIVRRYEVEQAMELAGVDGRATRAQATGPHTHSGHRAHRRAR